MAIRTWNSAGSHDMNLAGNYTGIGALLTTDTLLFNGTSVVDATATAGLDVDSISILPAYKGHFNDGALFMATHVIRAGGFHCNSGGALTLKGFWSVIVNANIEIINVVGAVDIENSYWGILGTTILMIDMPFGDVNIIAPGHVTLAANFNAGNMMINAGATFTVGAFTLTVDSIYAVGAAILDFAFCQLIRLRYNLTLDQAVTFNIGPATVIRFIGTFGGSIYSGGHAMPEIVCDTTYLFFAHTGTIRRLRLSKKGIQVVFAAGETFTITNVNPVADGWSGSSSPGNFYNGFSGWSMGGVMRARLILPGSYTVQYFWVNDMEILGGHTVTVVNGESYGNNRGWILPVTITSIEPAKGRVGDTINIYGNGFVYNQRGGEVYVGGKKLTIINWYDSYIEGKLPTLPDDGTVVLRIVNSDLNEAQTSFMYIYTDHILPKMFIAMPRIPYTYSQVVDVTVNNWDSPDDVMLAEVRCSPVSVIYKYRIALRAVTGIGCTIMGRNGDVNKVRLDRVCKFGTDPAVRKNCITVYGWKRTDIKEFLS